MPRPGTDNLPPFELKDYIRALRLMEYAGELPPKLLTLLRWQCTTEDSRANATELAAVTGMTVGEVNLIYGGAGKVLGAHLTGRPVDSFDKGWPFLAYGEYHGEEFHWFLHPPLKKALDVLELLLAEDESPRYVYALETLRQRKVLREGKTPLKLLRVHYAAPDHDVTTGELAEFMEWVSFSPANLFYGKLGAQFGEFLGPCPVTYDEDPSKAMTVAYLVKFWYDGEAWHWVMRRGLRRALEEAGLVTPRSAAESLALATVAGLPRVDPNALTEFPSDEASTREGERYWEGHARAVLVNRYERNPVARRKCIQHFGPQCQVCRVLLTDIYGPLALDYIQVHHVRPISDIGERYEVDPLNDLIPVCPNCHAMLHRRNPPLSVEELREWMAMAPANSNGNS